MVEGGEAAAFPSCVMKMEWPSFLKAVMALLPFFRFVHENTIHAILTLENLPPLPDLTPKDEALVSRRRHLESAWNVSPYYIEKPKAKSVGLAAEIERYSDRYKLSVQTKRPPLSSVLKLASAYFPAELLGQGNQKRNQRADGAQWTLQTGSAKNDLQRLDQLASLEQKRMKDGEDKEDVDKEEKKKKEGEEGDDDDDEEKLDDEDEEFGDDDYAQNFGFDDDEDYLDMDDGGDDEGATYT